MLNTEDLYDEVGDILLKRRGHRFTKELKLEMMGLPLKPAFEIMRKRFQLSESIAQLKAETDEIFSDIMPKAIGTMPGLMELLDRIESIPLPKCICTSSQRPFAHKALGYFDLAPRFEFVSTAEDVEQGKPHPEVYLDAAQQLGIEAENLMVLEDSHTGSRSGAAAGAFTVAVPTQHSRHLDFSHVNYVATGLADPFIWQTIQGQ